MPVITRSKSQKPSGLPSTSESTEPHPLSAPSNKIVRKSSDTTTPRDPTQHSRAPTKAGKAKRARPSPQKPRKRSCKHPVSDGTKRPQIATGLAPPDIPDNAVMHWPCRFCSCPKGVFNYPVNACIRCGHEMDDHEEYHHFWNPGCDFVCERQDLVASILHLVRNTRVVVIRATPLVGKSTLLKLLGRHILDTQRDLEPVFIYWEPKSKRDDLACDRYLQREESRWRSINAKYRPSQSTARTIYLIDEAQGSYEEETLWGQMLKSRNTRSRPMFVLVCVYGAAGISHTRESHVESQALCIDTLQRIELRQSTLGRPCMLFKPEETIITVEKWAIANRYTFENGLPQYLHAATDGHPGMIGLTLQYFEICFSQLSDIVRHTRAWSVNLCHELIVEHEGLVTWLTQHGRGVWTDKLEQFVSSYLHHHQAIFKDIKLLDVKRVLREVATEPHGLTRLPKEDLDVFAFCYRMGAIHTEQAQPGSKELTYMFASPIHRRVAYRRLFPGPEPDSAQSIPLQQVCLNAIQRFSPSTLQPRSTLSPHRWGIPEAAFQDEMYCCLNYELRNLPILSEYSHTKDGRVDFYVFDKKWCIEVLQCGSKTGIAEHAARFAPGGSYRTWNIFEDYIILNFCSKFTLSEIEIEGGDVQSHILQIVLDPAACTAEVYAHDNRLLATLILGEGRQRSYADDYDSPPDNTKILNAMHTQIMQMGKEKENIEYKMEQGREEMEEMRQRMGKEREEKEEMRQRMGKEREEKEEMRQQIERAEQENEAMKYQMEQMLESIKH